MDMECGVCLGKFKDFELQNPRFCCSVKLCKDCYNGTTICPQCRFKGPTSINLKYFEMGIYDEHIFMVTDFGHYEEYRTYNKDDGRLILLERMNEGSLYTADGQCNVTMFFTDGTVHHKWMIEDEDGDTVYHREDGPAHVVYKDGYLYSERYYLNGLPDDERPSVVYYPDGKVHGTYRHDGCVEYYNSGNKLRETNEDVTTLYTDSPENVKITTFRKANSLGSLEIIQ